MIVEEAQRVRDDIFDGNSARAVVGVRYEDLQLQILAFVARFELELVAAFVCDALDVEKERVVEAARAGVFHGDVAVDAVPGTADKLKRDAFGDVHAAIGEHIDLRIELEEPAFLGGERNRQEEEERQAA